MPASISVIAQGNAVLSFLRKIVSRRNSQRRLTTYRDRYRIAALLSVIPLPLTGILKLFGSDKQIPGEHSYGPTYQALLQPMRYKRVKLLEIGVLNGDSLLAWRCFFPFGTTVGIDIEPKAHLAGNRTRVYTADQGSAADLARVCQNEGPFDIIIDDGSHLSRHQIFAFHQTFEHLVDGGLYIIEDIQTSFWPGHLIGVQWDGKHVTDPAFGRTCYGEFLELAKYLNHAEFATLDGVDPMRLSIARRIKRIAFEHNMIIVWKGANEQRSNVMRRQD